MNWDGLRIAYAPYHKDLVAPGDRRRFLFYVNERAIRFELADPSEIYDIIYLTYGCNISVWIKYKNNNPCVKLVFELIDSYLLEGISGLSLYRGVARYLLGKESALWINYKTAFRKIISIADAVVCSTCAQKADMLRLNNNIHISLDYFSNDITHYKKSFESSGKLKLVWEGQAFTADNLLLLNEVFSELRDGIELYIITDPVVKAPLSIFDVKTNRLLRAIKCQYHLLDWNKSSFSEIVSNADLAIIPIASNKPMMWNKPENKLLLMWEIGMPTLTSDTPAYKRVMDEAGLDCYCENPDDWLKKIQEYIGSSKEYRRTISAKANSYLQSFHTKDQMLMNWDGIFESLQIS